jgi:hypothetical protein
MSTSGNESSNADPSNTKKRGNEDEDDTSLPAKKQKRVEKEDEQKQKERRIGGVVDLLQRRALRLRDILSQHQLLEDDIDFRIWNISAGCDDIIVGATRRATTLRHFETLLQPLGGDALSTVIPGRL